MLTHTEMYEEMLTHTECTDEIKTHRISFKKDSLKKLNTKIRSERTDKKRQAK